MGQFNKTSEIIRFHRIEKGWTQRDLAERAGVGKTVIFDIEKGKDTVQIDTLMKVLNILGIKVIFKSDLMNKMILKGRN